MFYSGFGLVLFFFSNKKQSRYFIVMDINPCLGELE